MNFFIPKDLSNINHDYRGFEILSKHFFKSAKELVSIVELSDKVYSSHILSAIILFTTTIESYFNEQLTTSLFYTKEGEVINYIEDLKLGRESSRKIEFKEKIVRIFKAYDSKGIGIDTNAPVFHDLVALINFRNELVHYNPNWDTYQKYPIRLQPLLDRSKIKLLNSGWTTNFSHRDIGQWAYRTVKNTIIEFSNMTGGRNPFDDSVKNKHLVWE